MAGLKNVVLVHGGFVDGAGWGGVYKILRKGGYQVSIVQNPTISLQDDAAATQRILATQDGPAILVGHSYGGAVITEAGTPFEGGGAGVYRRLCPRQRRVRGDAHQRFAARRSRAADSAAAGRLSVTRQGEVPLLVRG